VLTQHLRDRVSLGSGRVWSLTDATELDGGPEEA
jgi:hypothetical protein